MIFLMIHLLNETKMSKWVHDAVRSGFMKAPWVFILIVFGIFFDCHAAPNKEDQQKTTWIIKGQIAKRSRSHQMEETARVGASNPLTTVKYQKINPDGTIWFREETIFQARVKKIVIRNGDERFEIVGDSVIKDETPNALHPETVPAKPRQRFELIDADTILFDKKNKITRSEKPEQFADLEKLLKEIAKGEPAPQFPETVYLNRPCYVIEKNDSNSGKKERIVIDKKDHFILQRQVFDRDGKLTYETKVNSLTLDPELPGELFEIPEKAAVVTVKSNQELIKKQEEALQKAVLGAQEPAIPKKPHAFTNLDFWLRYSPYVLAALGAGCLLVILLLKLKEFSDKKRRSGKKRNPQKADCKSSSGAIQKVIGTNAPARLWPIWIRFHAWTFRLISRTSRALSVDFFEGEITLMRCNHPGGQNSDSIPGDDPVFAVRKVMRRKIAEICFGKREFDVPQRGSGGKNPVLQDFPPVSDPVFGIPAFDVVFKPVRNGGAFARDHADRRRQGPASAAIIEAGEIIVAGFEMAFADRIPRTRRAGEKNDGSIFAGNTRPVCIHPVNFATGPDFHLARPHPEDAVAGQRLGQQVKAGNLLMAIPCRRRQRRSGDQRNPEKTNRIFFPCRHCPLVSMT